MEHLHHLHHLTVEYLVVGGGGGANVLWGSSGGGGAGGYKEGYQDMVLQLKLIILAVGAGGADEVWHRCIF